MPVDVPQHLDEFGLKWVALGPNSAPIWPISAEGWAKSGHSKLKAGNIDLVLTEFDGIQPNFGKNRPAFGQQSAHSTGTGPMQASSGPHPEKLPGPGSTTTVGQHDVGACSVERAGDVSENGRYKVWDMGRFGKCLERGCSKPMSLRHGPWGLRGFEGKPVTSARHAETASRHSSRPSAAPEIMRFLAFRKSPRIWRSRSCRAVEKNI